MIDANGSNLGIISLEKALELAGQQGLDLIEIAPTAKPPVARIMDWGKFQYQLEKQNRQAKQKQKNQETKIIRFGLKIGENDLKIRAQQTNKFLKAGHKIKIELPLRGREKAHFELAQKKLNYFLSLINEPFQIELETKKQPKGLVTLISPHYKKNES